MWMANILLSLLLFQKVEAQLSSCYRNEGVYPRVEPWNSSHIQVDWEGLFKECTKEHVRTMKLVMNEKVNDNFLVKFEDKQFLIKQSPCSRISICLRLECTALGCGEADSTIGKRFLYSKTFIYNNQPGTIQELYSVIFKRVVLDKVCLKENSTLIIPEPPKILSECILTKGGEIEKPGLRAGQNTTLVFTIVDPQDASKSRTVTAPVASILKCDITTSSEPFLDSKTILALSIGLPMSLTLSLLLLAICLKKCRKNPANIPNMANIVPKSTCSLCISNFDEDQNEDYGVYYSGGQRVEIESEVRDYNVHYEATEQQVDESEV